MTRRKTSKEHERPIRYKNIEKENDFWAKKTAENTMKRE